MKRLIIAFVVALLAGTGVASATSVMRAKPAPVAADSTKHATPDSGAVRVVDSLAGVAGRAKHTDSLPAATKATPADSSHARTAAEAPSAHGAAVMQQGS